MSSPSASSAKASFLVGATGLVSRPSLGGPYQTSKIPESRLKPTIDSDSQTWASHIKSLNLRPQILFSGTGTTRGAPGSFEAQRGVDYDLNVSLARTAKQAGVETYVLISVTGVNSKSIVPNSKVTVKPRLSDVSRAPP